MGQLFIILRTGEDYNWDGMKTFQKTTGSMKLSGKFSSIVV